MFVGDFFFFWWENFIFIFNGNDCDRGNGICKIFMIFYVVWLWLKNKCYNGFIVIC